MCWCWVGSLGRASLIFSFRYMGIWVGREGLRPISGLVRVECLVILLCLVFTWLWARSVDWVRCFFGFIYVFKDFVRSCVVNVRV